jgi:uncharacterized repeat protein (TIGR03803 family)
MLVMRRLKTRLGSEACRVFMKKLGFLLALLATSLSSFAQLSRREAGGQTRYGFEPDRAQANEKKKVPEHESESAKVPRFSVLYSFTGGADGGTPFASVIRDREGNLYGTTSAGGAFGLGTVFRLNKIGTETVLQSFAGPPGDGATPLLGSLVRDGEGSLYGTTSGGGASGAGAVFKLDTTGAENLLYSFTGGADGGSPFAGLFRDEDGNLYGTTFLGGASDFGTVFKVDKTGTQTVLYSFGGGADGGLPFAGVVRDTEGNLYGTTSFGGSSGLGTAFKLDRSGVETVLHSFTGGVDGGAPAAGLLRDQDGNLYGTTSAGGTLGFGTVFKLDKSGVETVLYSFTGGADGGTPTARVVRDQEGNLYGTTSVGGVSNVGTVFKLNKSGMETVLYSFTGGADGGSPTAGLLRDGEGNLYGTTSAGGSGFGTVFRLTRDEEWRK